MLDLRIRCASLVKPRPGRRTAVLVIFLGLAAAVHAAAGAPRRPIEAPAEMEVATPEAASLPAGLLHAAPTDDGRVQVMVELQDPPAAVAFAAAM
ncbi:MAG TPA: hypothetical protein VN999_19625, partial [Thermoanaerobaculia bacterium]|nr:hypothetical protein [Thermoanaerobaculia bacterium]